MSFIKKYLVFILLIVTTFVAFGCAKRRTYVSDFDVDEDEISFDEEIEITFYSTMGKDLVKVLDKALDEFKKLYPNIIVNHTSIGGYDDVFNQISDEIQVDDQPNLAYCYPDHVAYYNLANAVVKLDNLIASTATVKHDDGTTEVLGLTQEQIDDYIKGYYDEGKVYGDDHMYTLPFSKSTEVLYYNKTAFEKNKWKVPTTWDEMKELCIKIKEKDPDCIPLGYDSEANWFITMCEQYGYPYTSSTAPHYLFNTPEARAFVKEFRSWYSAGLVTTQQIFGGYTSGLFTESDPKKVHSYMSIGSSAGATKQRPSLDAEGEYPFEVGIATIPQVNPDKPKVISQGPSLCIFSKENSKEVIASWLLAKYLTTSVTFQAQFSLVSGYVPVIKSVANHKTYATKLENADGFDNIASLSAKICLEQEAAYYVSPAFSGSSEARKQVGILIKLCFESKWDEDKVDLEIEKVFIDCVKECEYFS